MAPSDKEGNPLNVYIEYLTVGDSFGWCGRVVTLCQIEYARTYAWPRGASRRLHVMLGLPEANGRHQRRDRLRLHYFDNEKVELVRAG